MINLPPDPDIGNDESISGSTQLNVADGGRVGFDFEANSGSEVNISGGTIGSSLGANSGSEVNISGGTLRNLGAGSGSVVNVNGGTVDIMEVLALPFGIFAGSGSVVNISGGTIRENALSTAGEVNITGTQFILNGRLLDALVVGESFTIAEPIETITGILADGSSFSFGGNGVALSGFSPDATVTLTLSLTLGDVNRDGEVNFLDISPFIALLSAGDFQEEADIDGNGVVNFLDIAPFINLLTE